ncbi:cytochrome b [Methylobacterium sp. JK268]
MTPSEYSSVQKLLHWLIAILIFGLVPVAIVMTSIGEGPLQDRLFDLHKSFGLTVLALVLARILVRASRGAPGLVDGLPAWQRAAARASHLALYGLILLVPVLGWAGTSACCAPVEWFGLVPVTLPISGGMPVGEKILNVHVVAAFLLTALVLVHGAAALHHHFARRDPTLRRMLPE